MSEPIFYLDRSRVRPGAASELRAAVAGLLSFVEEREPQLLAYGFSIDEAEQSMVVTAVHPDSASLERHLAIGGDEFRRVGQFIELLSIEVVGDVTQAARNALDEKARALGTAVTVDVRPITVGFSRLMAS